MATKLKKTLTLYGGMAFAVREHALHDQRATPQNDGIALVVRKALREYLVKRGYGASFLDRFDIDVETGLNTETLTAPHIAPVCEESPKLG